LTGDRVGFHMDDYYKTVSSKLRSVDLIVSANKPTKADFAVASQKVAVATTAANQLQQLNIIYQTEIQKVSKISTGITNIGNDLINLRKELGTITDPKQYKKKLDEFNKITKQRGNKIIELQTVKQGLVSLKKQIAAARAQAKMTYGEARTPGSQNIVIEILIIEIDDPRT